MNKETFTRLLRHPGLIKKAIIRKMITHNMLDRMPDSLYLKLRFRDLMNTRLDIKTPKTFNEKLQWLKINDRNPEYIKLVDKYEVRSWIQEKIGAEYLIPMIDCWDDVEDIDFNSLPDRFVLKCTHGSHCNIICQDKSKLDIDKAKNNLKSWMKINYYYHSREWPYKDVKPRIVAEQFMSSNDSDELTDYKFYCYGGKPDVVMMCTGRNTDNLRFFYFDRDWNFYRYNFVDKNLPDDFTVPKPECMDRMFEIAEKLSAGIPYVRVDLYESGEKIYFGEMTFYPAGGFDLDITPSTDAIFGAKLQLPTRK